MTRDDIKLQTNEQLRDRAKYLNLHNGRYIRTGRFVIDTENEYDPEALQELIWINNELMRRESAHDTN